MFLRREKVLAVSGFFAALAASLCCIGPFLIAVVGVSGLAFTFSWFEPFRLPLAFLSIVALSLAWLIYFRDRREHRTECGCDTEDRKTRFFQKAPFLLFITLLSFTSLAFPFLVASSAPEHHRSGNTAITEKQVPIVVLSVRGMSCAGCETQIQQKVGALPGVQKVKASYQTGKVEVVLDTAETGVQAVIRAIADAGYLVTEYSVMEPGEQNRKERSEGNGKE